VSTKQLVRLGLVFLALLVLWGAAALGRHRATGAGPTDVLALPPVARSAVDTVVLAKTADTVVLARKGADEWTVNGFPASAAAVNDLFAALADSSSGSELVAERRSSFGTLGVDSTGTHVRVKGRGKTLADLVVGHRSPEFSGGYVRLADQDRTYLVHGRLVELLTRSGDEWRDHRIAAVTADSIGAIQVSHGARHYELRRAGARWTMTPGGPADSAKAAGLLAAYRAVEAAGFASGAQADSAHFTPPDRRVRVLRKDGSPLLTLLFDSTAGGSWVRSDTGKTIYRLDQYATDRLTPADTALRPQPTKPSKR
jgi:uncharacterized protein DUF4340